MIILGFPGVLSVSRFSRLSGSPDINAETQELRESLTYRKVSKPLFLHYLHPHIRETVIYFSKNVNVR